MTMIEKITRRLEEMDLTQEGLEAMVGLSANRISKWKNGTGQPTAKQALAIARAIDLPLEFLVDDDLDEIPAASPGLSPDERAVLALYRVRRKIEGEGFSPEELGDRIAEPREHPVGQIRMGGAKMARSSDPANAAEGSS